MTRHSLDDLRALQRSRGSAYLEFERSAALSAGLYVLPAGAADTQRPHSEDEVYVVLAGRARFTCAGDTSDVQAGDTIYVPAGAEHRFHDITADLHLIVVFAPPEYSRREAEPDIATR